MLKIPTVEKFLCCIKLELGALIIGWVNLLWSTLMLLLLASIFIASIVAHSKILRMLPEDSYCLEIMQAYPPILVKFVIILALTYFGVYFLASKRLVESLKTRNPADTIPFIGILIFDFIFSILSILHLSWIALIQASVRIVYYAYVFIFIYSVKQFLHEEIRSGRNRNSQYQSAPLTMYKF